MSAPGPWTGASGRLYRAVPDTRPSEGSSRRATVAVAEGEGSDPPAGKRVVVLEPLRRSTPALDAFERELVVLERLSDGGAASPAPRFIERLADGSGAIVEWCPTTLEQWWITVAREPDGLRNLCLALADVCRRVADHAAVARREPEVAASAPSVRPRSVLRTPGGRWVISGYGRIGGGLQSADDEAGTEMMTSASAFVPPEVLFEAESEHPLAVQTWAIGACFFALLKTRVLLAPDDRGRTPEVPAGGTDSPHLRSHRAILIEDLLQRKPGMFKGRPLDPRQFLYPDRLPDRDRRTVAEALRGLFGEPQEVLEGQLAREILRVLDSALSIDPGRRYLDPVVMAGDLEGLARRFRTMRSTIAAARFDDRSTDDEATRLFSDEQTQVDRPDGGEETQVEGLDDAALAEIEPEDLHAEPEGGDEDASDESTDDIVAGRPVDEEGLEPGTFEQPTAELAPVPAAPRRAHDDLAAAAATPLWVKGAVGGLALGQVLTLGLCALLWLRLDDLSHGPAPGPATAATALLEGLDAPDVPTDAAAPAPPPPVPADTGAVAEAPPAVPEPAAEPVAAPQASSPPPASPAPAATTPPVAAASSRSPASPAVGAASAAAGTTRSTTATASASREAAPAPAAEPAPAEPAATTATITISGGKGYLLGASGRVSFGQVAPGSYTVMVGEGDAVTEAGRVTVSPGEVVRVRCGFGQCRFE